MLMNIPFESPCKIFLISILAYLSGCNQSSGGNEPRARASIRRLTGHVILPPGTVDLHEPLTVRGAHDLDIEGAPTGTELRLAPDFKGKAAILVDGAKRVRIENLRIVGIRHNLKTTTYLPPAEVSFVAYYNDNGIVCIDSESIQLRNLSFENITTFPVLVSHCNDVSLEELSIKDSGTLNQEGRSNTTGGILLEEGTRRFRVQHCRIERICGNGIWTHSNLDSFRNQDGVIADNEVSDTPRDAIQVGHAVHVEVIRNHGTRIGFPVDEVDLPAEAVPVALDSAGNTEGSTYAYNNFKDVNGQCIDLDGFHDGLVTSNSCINLGPPEAYVFSHVGIVFGNSNPGVQPQKVTLTDNVVEGFGYGGVFLIGRDQRVENNRFINVNRNHCSGDMRVLHCNYAPEEPGMLRSGIYLAGHAARMTETAQNIVRGNYISGFGMGKWCVAAGPGVRLDLSQIESNTCIPTR